MYTKMTLPEWDKTTQAARNRFITDVLGERPTRKSVAKTLHNAHEIDWLEWLGVIVLLAISIVTGFKMSAAAMPFARSFFNEATPEWIIASFQFWMAIAFILMSTSMLIYAKLMDEFSAAIEAQKRKYPKLTFFGGWQGSIGATMIVAAIFQWVIGASPDVIGVASLVTFIICLYFKGIPSNLLQFASPRMYQWLVYIIALWLFKVSTNGAGDVFERFTMVLAEIALAYLVANVIEKQNQWRKVVHTAWVEAYTPYDDRLANYFTDKDFLEILFREIRHTLTTLERRHPDKANQKYRPNTRIMQEATSDQIDQMVLTEYTNNTGGKRFVSAVLKGAEPLPVSKNEEIRIGLRLPPRGDAHWTVETLQQDFQIRGIKPDAEYNEVNLFADYENGYKAREAFRSGANLYFKGYPRK